MIVELSNTPPPKKISDIKGNKYPILAIHSALRYIVLFVACRKAVILEEGNSSYNRGEFGTIFDEEDFVTFDQKITLSNG